MQVNKAASQYQDRLRNNELVRVPNIPIEEIAVKLRQLMPFKKFDVTVTGDDINIRCYIDVRRHIVGGANRTLFSVDLPPRLCRTGT